jgi:oligosaccharyl transferase complex subunit OST4
MISDDELYRLAIFLGSAAMLLIILYHFLEVNAIEEPATTAVKLKDTSTADSKEGSTINK